MDSVDMHRMQENEAYGCWLIHAIGDRIGCGTDIDLIKKAIYKGTDCGEDTMNANKRSIKSLLKWTDLIGIRM
jgi:hypothetical protein